MFSQMPTGILTLLFGRYTRCMSKSGILKFRSEIALVCVLLLVFWLVGIGFYHFVEGLALVDAVYLSAMTLTTVGYGDFTPQTDVGKLFTSVYAFLGIGVFFGFATALMASVVNRAKR